MGQNNCCSRLNYCPKTDKTSIPVPQINAEFIPDDYDQIKMKEISRNTNRRFTVSFDDQQVKKLISIFFLI